MNQSDFEAFVWTQWATAPNEEIQIEELRPMREVQLTGKRGSGVEDAPWMFTAWAVAYPDDGKRYNWNEATTSWDEIVS